MCPENGVKERREVGVFIVWERDGIPYVRPEQPFRFPSTASRPRLWCVCVNSLYRRLSVNIELEVWFVTNPFHPEIFHRRFISSSHPVSQSFSRKKENKKNKQGSKI